MINSRWGTEIIDEARDYNAHDPDEEIEVDEPRFKSHMNRNHVRFQQRENDNEENAGEHVRNQLCHTLKIVQIKHNSCKKSEKRYRKTRLYWILSVACAPSRMTKMRMFKTTRLHWMGQAPTSSARLYPCKHGCNTRLSRLSSAFGVRMTHSSFV